MFDYDIIFISETHAQAQILQDIDGFYKLADPSFNATKHGGMAAYVKLSLSSHITNLRFSKCSLSFALSIMPQFCFMVVYIYPVDSLNFTLGDFGTLSEDILFWTKQGITPFIGGDINARLGDINVLSQKTLKWRYKQNVDPVANSHGKKLADLCELHDILPLNHCCYYSKVWDGKFTYNKGGKHSQIDFVLTTGKGRRYVNDFTIVNTGWHMSDHLPLALKVSLPFDIDAGKLLLRAMDLVETYRPLSHLNSCRFEFDYDSAAETFSENYQLISDSCNQGSPDIIIKSIESCLIPILKMNKIGCKRKQKLSVDECIMKECDTLYQVYIDKLQNPLCTTVEIKLAYSVYQEARNKLNSIVFSFYENEYKDIIDTEDEKALWGKINWSGRRESGTKPSMSVQTMSNYFESLYQPLHSNEVSEMQQLSSNIYIPVTDDPISEAEVLTACNTMKKGGYDFSLSVLKILVSGFLPILLVLFNLVFYVAYPMKFTLSLLCAIPKKGNLSLLTNFRGIHMQNLLSLVYDRIIASRLILWAKIHPEQTAFQKGKSTLDQIFLLRTIIALIRQANMSLYIAFFDLEKAFDKVSRPLLLKALLRLGIGSGIFYAIKYMYATTKCVLKAGKKLSEVFSSYSGIKQGAPSSVVLFVIFMDEFVDIVRQKCVTENILGMLHILLHADDTAVISTNAQLFIKKCNALLDAFKDKRVSLNLKKSGYLIINPRKFSDRTDVKLSSGWLFYKSSFMYLGAIFSDNGTIHHDINLHTNEKVKSVYVKLANFMRNNPAAPITVKRKILTACLNASLLYGSETWGGSSLRKIETVYRMAIKITFGMNSRTPNEIVFLETGLTHLKAEIYKRQHKFWSKVLKKIEMDSLSSVALIFSQALDKNTHYIRHYKNLHKDFGDADTCYNFYVKEFTDKMKRDIKQKAAAQEYGIVNDYVQLNSDLSSPSYYHKYILPEVLRQILTKYRSGSHYLKIVTGSFLRIPMEERLCKCKEIQTLQHVIFDCTLTQLIREDSFCSSMKDFFKNDIFAAEKLQQIEDILKLRKF